MVYRVSKEANIGLVILIVVNDSGQAPTSINRFAFVIHPLDVGYIYRHSLYGWARALPVGLVEWIAARVPPVYLSRIRGAKSPTTGQSIEGYLYTLGSTPRQMLKRDPRTIYRQLARVAHLAEGRGARILGLGAFTSVIGDAGITVAEQANIAITTGNSLTAAVTMETIQLAMDWMGIQDLSEATAMVIGATGSIGSICARMLAEQTKGLILASLDEGKTIRLKNRIQAETPAASVDITTRANDFIDRCDLIISATSASGKRVLDITRCKPGTVICDVANPPDISASEAASRPDVLVVGSGEVILPGEIDIGYDIGLPPNTVFACMAETALLAMEGRFVDFTIGRDLVLEQVEEIYSLFKKHKFRSAGLRMFGAELTREIVAEKRALAAEIQQRPYLLDHMKTSVRS